MCGRRRRLRSTLVPLTATVVHVTRPGKRADALLAAVASHLGRGAQAPDERGHVRVLLEEPEGAAWDRVHGQLMSSVEAGAPSLQALLDAFNAHDVDAIMSFFTDCVFDTPCGPAPGGHRLVGKEQVRKGFQARFDGIPDIDYGDDRHWTCGPRKAPWSSSTSSRRPVEPGATT
jgi:hypothetical protein